MTRQIRTTTNHRQWNILGTWMSTSVLAYGFSTPSLPRLEPNLLDDATHVIGRLRLSCRSSSLTILVYCFLRSSHTIAQYTIHELRVHNNRHQIAIDAIDYFAAALIR